MKKELKQVNREQLLKEGAIINKVTSETISISISHSVSTEEKKVEIVTFAGGGQALIVNGILFKPEIMLYNYDQDSDTDENVTIGQAGLQIVSLDGAEIQEE